MVEDDVKLVRALKRGLEHEGYLVEAVLNGDDALSRASSEEYDAIVLDLMLPGLDGYAICETLRDREQWTPVLMLTARADVGDRIRGLDAGADDYLVKPFDFGELLARLRVLIRRGPAALGQVLTAGDLRADSTTRIVTRAGAQVQLTAREFEVLTLLMSRPGRLVSREQLLDAIWGEGYDGSPNIADVHVGHLRRKLESPGSPGSPGGQGGQGSQGSPAGRRVIRTVRGKGFLLEAT